MRTAVQLSAGGGDWGETVTFVQEAERLGVDVCWVAEAWGGDAVTPLGYLAAKTERILLGSGVFQLGVRSATMTAMTAMTLQDLSDGRFLLGLGASGPQVIEGLHGVPFERPLTRMRETLDVLALAMAGERVAYEGSAIRLPLPGREGKAMRLAAKAPETPIPVYLASLSPKMLELTGERAQGWLGTSFVPEGAQAAYYDHLERGAVRGGRSLADIDLCQGAEVAFGDDFSQMAQSRKPGLAFSLGGMGSATTNFYNQAYARLGFADVAAQAQQLWVAGDRDEAANIIPDEMVMATTLIGPEELVAARLKVWAEAGINTVRLYPAGDTLDERLATLARALELVADV